MAFSASYPCSSVLIRVPFAVLLLAGLAWAAEAPEIVTASLPDAVVGVAYKAKLEASGGKPPYHWSLQTPGIPEGLVLDPASGEISGRPLTAATAHFTVGVEDSSRPPQSATRLLTLRVANPLALLTTSLPPGGLGAPYDARLQVGGGIAPYKWQIVRGTLPSGLLLNRDSGVISGTAANQGDFIFTVRVTDAASPPQSQTRDLRVVIPPPLSVAWVQPPRLADGSISGSVRAFNGTRNTVDLTLIVVAVNEYGKAFALGYQHLPLGPFTGTPVVPFSSSLPFGRYTVHVDAVSEFAPTVSIHRARLQEGPFDNKQP
jgi:hypothetical protein